MLALKHMEINRKLEKLQCTFPKLTEANQQYVLGLAEGLKQAQNGRPSQQPRGAKTNGRVKEG